jgi:hypothetical protein
MEVAKWKLYTVGAVIVLMIISHLLAESTTVSAGTGNFFNVVAWVTFLSLLGGGAYWFFTSKTR